MVEEEKLRLGPGDLNNPFVGREIDIFPVHDPQIRGTYILETEDRYRILQKNIIYDVYKSQIIKVRLGVCEMDERQFKEALAKEIAERIAEAKAINEIRAKAAGGVP